MFAMGNSIRLIRLCIPLHVSRHAHTISSTSGESRMMHHTSSVNSMERLVFNKIVRCKNKIFRIQSITMVPYRERVSLEARQKDCANAMQKKPTHIPTIVEPSRESRLPPINGTKFLLPRDMTGGELQYVLRKRTKLDPAEAFFIMCEGKLISPTRTIAEMHHANRDPFDGFLYLNYTTENAFG